MTKGKVVTVFASCTVLITALGTVAGFTARADDLGTGVYNGVSGLRQACGVLDDDPRLTAAAQQHANDMLKNSVDGHIGSDGSSPGARIADAGYTSAGYTGEIGAPGPLRLRPRRSTRGWKVPHTGRSS